MSAATGADDVLIPAYALCSYLAAVLLMRYWLRLEGMSPFSAFFGSMLFCWQTVFPDTSPDYVCELFTILLLALIFLKNENLR